MSFSKKGVFFDKISNHGKGPGEYITPFDFEIANGKYSVYCADLYKIINYDIEGNYLSEFRLNNDFRPLSITIHYNGYFADCFPDEELNYILVFFDSDGFKINEYFKFDDNANIRIPLIVKSLCKSYNGNVLYSPFNSKNIYIIKDRNNIDLVYEINIIKIIKLWKVVQLLPVYKQKLRVD